MQQPLISIIVPCYNCEAYVERCIKSILNQSYTNIEIIAVNDGSVDRTLNILIELSKSDQRLVVINQNNSGVSCARNKGIERATGSYFVFCDSDDFVGENYIEDFFKCSNFEKTLVFQYPSVYDETNKNVLKESSVCKTQIYSVSSGVSQARLLHNGYPFGKLFKTSVVKSHELKFDENIEYKEDLIFILEYLKYVDSISLIPGKDYYYCVHSGSLSNKWKRPENVIRINKIVLSLVKDYGLLAGYKTAFEEFCIGETIHLMYNSPESYKVSRKALKDLRESFAPDSYPIQNKLDYILRFWYKKRLFGLFRLTKRFSMFVLKYYK